MNRTTCIVAVLGICFGTVVAHFLESVQAAEQRSGTVVNGIAAFEYKVANIPDGFVFGIEVLNTPGADGWELVGIIPPREMYSFKISSNMNNVDILKKVDGEAKSREVAGYFIFKRPISPRAIQVAPPTPPLDAVPKSIK